jgi:hypothetical protein
MTDIVERLRDKHCCDDTCYCDEAAAEIERLRAALEACEQAATAHHTENLDRTEWSGSSLAQRKARAISARSGVLMHNIKAIARAALTAQPAAPGGDK